MDKPIQLKNIDVEKLKEACQNYLNFIDDDEGYSDDRSDRYENDVFEAAMSAVFGEDVWEFVRNRQEDR